MLYEDQADLYDKRAGIPVDAIDAVADAFFDIVQLPEGSTLLEVGAGTGLLSIPFVRRPIHYIGFDRSPAMLGVFREKLDSEGLVATLVEADGNERWPADDKSVDAIFSSRALHHLEIDHIISETARVVRPGSGWLVAGRVRRDDGAVNSILRRRMLDLLSERGYTGRSGGSGGNRLASALERFGGTLLPPRAAARWSVERSPADVLASWASKEGLAGVEIPSDVKSSILAELHQWTAERYPDINLPVAHQETYELLAIDLRQSPIHAS